MDRELWMIHANVTRVEHTDYGHKVTSDDLPSFMLFSDLGEAGALAAAAEILLVDGYPLEQINGPLGTGICWRVSCCPNHTWVIHTERLPEPVR